jgi:hypothetical protein
MPCAMQRRFACTPESAVQTTNHTTYGDITLKLPSASRTARIRFANDESQHHVSEEVE